MSTQAKKLVSKSFQVEAVEDVFRVFNEGHKNTLLVAATGAGKTIMGLMVIDRYLREHPDARVLWLAHTIELVGKQPTEKIMDFFPDLQLKLGTVMAAKNDVHAQIIFGSNPTLGGKDEKRISELVAAGPIDLLVYDECHHAAAERNKAIIDYLRAACPDMFHLGMTATPIRSDEKDLGAIYDVEAYGKPHQRLTLARMVKLGELVPPRWLAVQTGISIHGVAKTRNSLGEPAFNGVQLANVFEVDNCLDLVVATHKQYALGRQAIAFTVSVEGARVLTDKFNEGGISAAFVHAGTKKDERKKILNDYELGEIEVICNVAVLTEGYDAPRCSVIHNVAPTLSDSAYLQKVGRGLRKVAWIPDKEDCIIFDYMPKDGGRDLTFLGKVLGAKTKLHVIEDPDKEPGEILDGFTFNGKDVKWLSGSPNDLLTSVLDYLNDSPLKWVGQRMSWLTLSIGEGEDGVDRSLAISPPDENGWSLYGIGKYPDTSQEMKETKSGKMRYPTRTIVRLLLESADFKEITDRAEMTVALHGQSILTRKKQANWRKVPVSEGQLRSFSFLVENCRTCGDASDLIGRYMVLNTLAANRIISRDDAKRHTLMVHKNMFMPHAIPTPGAN